jgi:hypothetical protein
MLMFAVAAGALVLAGIELFHLVAGNARLADTLAGIEARREALAKGPAPAVKADPAELGRSRAIRLVSQKLTTPWGDLLESLESVPVPTVAVLSIEPSVSKRSIRITAEARSPQDMLAYLGALQQEPRLSNAVLVSHQVQLQAPGTPVRFQMQANWGVTP